MSQPAKVGHALFVIVKGDGRVSGECSARLILTAWQGRQAGSSRGAGGERMVWAMDG